MAQPRKQAPSDKAIVNQLFQLIREGTSWEKIKKLLDSKVSVEVRDGRRRSLLDAAVEAKTFHFVPYLLRYGYCVTDTDSVYSHMCAVRLPTPLYTQKRHDVNDARYEKARERIDRQRQHMEVAWSALKNQFVTRYNGRVRSALDGVIPVRVLVSLVLEYCDANKSFEDLKTLHSRHIEYKDNPTMVTELDLSHAHTIGERYQAYEKAKATTPLHLPVHDKPPPRRLAHDANHFKKKRPTPQPP
jgi:hypothetical protein